MKVTLTASKWTNTGIQVFSRGGIAGNQVDLKQRKETHHPELVVLDPKCRRLELVVYICEKIKHISDRQLGKKVEGLRKESR